MVITQFFYYNLHNTLNLFDIDDMHGRQKISKNNLPNGYLKKK
jgi:hypothetical protein